MCTAAAAEAAAAARASAQGAKDEAAKAKADAVAAKNEAAGALADSAVAIGQATATATAARETAAAAATVAAPADEAIALAASWAKTDLAAGLSALTSEAAKSIAQQQADVAAAQATQAATLAAAAQDAANRAAGDAKLAAQAAADAAASASKAAASAAAATKAAVQAAADAKATQQASDRIDAMDAKAQDDVDKCRAAAAAADGSADAAEAAADESERDAAAAGAAADDAAADAALADDYADDAEESAAEARDAANNAQASADAAQAALTAIDRALASNPKSPGELAGTDSEAIATGADDVYILTIETHYSFDPTSDCVGLGGCDVTGNYTSKGFYVYLLASCITPSSIPDECINTGSGPQVQLDELMTVPYEVTTPAKIHVTQRELLDATLKALPGMLFGEFIGCYKKATPSDDGGSWLDCGFVVAELVLPAAVKGIAIAAKELRLAMIAFDVAGIDAALASLRASAIDVRTLAKFQKAALAARSQAILDGLNSCLRVGHSFAAGTGVLMADGSVRAIEDVRVGDRVRNATPAATVEVHQVTELHVTTTDTQFTELTIQSGDRTSAITGTQNHPFYSLTRHQFVDAAQLVVGDRLQTYGSEFVTVAAVRNYTEAMTTYDLTVEGVHAYFVDNGGLPVLVHNACPVIQAVQKVLGLTPGKWVHPADGLKVEDALGGNLRPNYPYIDSYDAATRTGTSIKTIDWRQDAYNTPARFASKARTLLKDLSNGKRFDDGWYTAEDVRRADIDNWVLRIAYPKDLPAGYMEKLMGVVDEAKPMGITIFLHPIDG